MTIVDRSETSNALDQFRTSLERSDLIAWLADGLIGKDATIDGPFGRRPLVYADYVASGRALMQIEQFMLEEVLPYYANSHTEASHCGGFITRLRRAARSTIARCCGADVRRQGFWDNRRRELTEALVHQVCHIRPLHLDEASGAV